MKKLIIYAIAAILFTGCYIIKLQNEVARLTRENASLKEELDNAKKEK